MLKSNGLNVRDTLFGDLPLSKWPTTGVDDSDVEPWRSFLRARRNLEAKNKEGAVKAFQEIVATSDLESRHYLQAWHFLRSLGVSPPDSIIRDVYGVVAEVAMEAGLDIVAGYADHSARYYNFSGAAVIWDVHEKEMDALIDRLLEAGQRAVEAIGLWEGARPPAPDEGYARVNMLTPGGLYFGEGPFEVLSTDPLGAPLIETAVSLMGSLVARVQ